MANVRWLRAAVVVVIAACGDDGGQRPDAPVADAAEPDAAIDAAPDAPVCATPTGAGTMHGGSVATAEVWTAAASPHLLPFDTSVTAVITLEPCAVVRIAGGRTISVRQNGGIVAAGVAGLPVAIEAMDASAPWASIRTLGGDLSFTHTIIRGGGDRLNTTIVFAAAIQFSRGAADTAGTLHMDDVEIADSASGGVLLSGVAGFDATSQDVRIHGSAGWPIHTFADVLGTIPPGTYTGNAHDEIILSNTSDAVAHDQTMHDRGIPYHVGVNGGMAQLDVVSFTEAPPVLTIEPGVTVKFERGGRMRVSPPTSDTPALGALVAVGTAAKPIVFTSDAATPAAGDWLGIWFAGAADPRSRLAFVRVEYAGGTSVTGSSSCSYPGRPTGINDAAIRILGGGAPPGQFITDTEIRDSALDGIDRGWRADFQPDFLAGNTFTRVAGCKQTLPRTANGVCPASPPCP